MSRREKLGLLLVGALAISSGVLVRFSSRELTGGLPFSESEPSRPRANDPGVFVCDGCEPGEPPRPLSEICRRHASNDSPTCSSFSDTVISLFRDGIPLLDERNVLDAMLVAEIGRCGPYLYIVHSNGFEGSLGLYDRAGRAVSVEQTYDSVELCSPKGKTTSMHRCFGRPVTCRMETLGVLYDTRRMQPRFPADWPSEPFEIMKLKGE